MTVASVVTLLGHPMAMQHTSFHGINEVDGYVRDSSCDVSSVPFHDANPQSSSTSKDER
jgi:hypothetical protein